MDQFATPKSFQHSSFFIWAHRGASAQAPENTMTALRLAREFGADGIELDVHLSRDGVPVVIHDETLDRTTDGTGPVAALTLAELRRLDAGSWFDDDFRGEPLPTLAEAFDVVGELALNIEIKSHAAGVAVLDLMASRPGKKVLVSSFDHALLADLRRQVPDMPLGFLCDSRWWRRALARAVRCRATSFHPRIGHLSRPLMAACRRQGLAVYPWTVDGTAELQRCRRVGVDGLFTNDPGKMRRLIGC